jgi:hypothetical protein
VPRQPAVVLAPATPPRPTPLQSPPPSSAPAGERRATDAELAQLFPWLRLDMHAASAAVPAAACASAVEEDDGDDGCCAICMDAARDTALEPCGHALLCAACAHRVLRTAVPACPVCRVAATGFRAV